MSSASLIQATHSGDRAAVLALLSTGANPSERDARGWTPLHYAVLSGSQAIVTDLIRAGAEVDAAAPDGATPLIKAALWCHADIVRVLLAAGANPLRRDASGWSALELADAAHCSDVASVLRASVNPHEQRNAS